MKRLVLLVLLFRALAVFADDAKKMIEITIPTAADFGMCGPHTAYTDNVYAMLVNPAAIVRVQQNSTGNVSLSVTDPEKALNTLGSIGEIIYKLFTEGFEVFEDIPGILDLGGTNLAGFDLREFPLGFARVSNGLGIGIWNRIYTGDDFFGDTDKSNLYCDVIIPISVAFPVIGTDHHSLDIGVTFKPFARIIMKDDFTEIPFIAGTGINAGILYRWNIGLSAGFTANDIITRGKKFWDPQGNEETDYNVTVPMTLNFGVAFDLKVGNFAPDAPDFIANTGIAVAADWNKVDEVFWQDNSFQYQNIWQKANAGIQLTLFDILMLRCGIKEGSFATGAGVNLGLFRIDAAYYRNVHNTPVLELSFGTKSKAKDSNWFWAQNPLIGGYSGSTNTEGE